jgi:hypothetical protein
MGCELRVEIHRRAPRPRADLLADIAAGHHDAHPIFELGRDLRMVFHGQIGDAAPGVEDLRLDKCLGRTRVEAGGAGPAVLGPRTIRFEVEAGEQETEKQLGAELTVEQHRVLADPPQTRVCGPFPFEDRGGVDARPPTATRPLFPQPPPQTNELLFEDPVVVAAPRIA